MNQFDRRGFFEAIGRGIAIFFAGLASGSAAQSRIRIEQVRGGPGALAGFDASGQGQSVMVGTGLALSGGTLTATIPPASLRQYNVVLARDPSGSYPLPVGTQARSVVYRNGLRQTVAQDFNLTGGVVVPIGGWPSDDLVTADGE